MVKVSLDDVLTAREKRVQYQMELLNRFDFPVICFTMNIAGPEKDSALIRDGLKTMDFKILEKIDLSSPAGHCLLLAVDAPAEKLKQLCVSLENLDELGRLLDMDVIDTKARKLTREAERSCLICGLPGRGCARARIHSVEQLQQKTSQIIQDYRVKRESERIASLAVQSLLDEVCVTPKPGLVDCHDCGSHRDMNLFSFNASAAALYPYFQSCYRAGIQERQATAERAFGRLQVLGVEAEGAMRRATGGVNTHKGAIYTLGVLCGAAGSGIREIMSRLNTLYVSENLSPGGCADLLAATLLVDRWINLEA